MLLYLLGLVSLSVSAQSPGGVSGAVLWYKAVPLTSDLQGRYRWQDFSGDSVKLLFRRSSESVFSEFTQLRTSLHTINFHPALYLSEGQTGKYADLTATSLSQATVFGVFASLPSTSGTDMVLYVLNGRKNAGTVFTKDKVVRVRGVDPLDYGDMSGDDLLYGPSDTVPETEFRASFPRIATYFKADKPCFSLWGETNRASVLFGTDCSTVQSDIHTDYDTSTFGNEAFDGYTSEYLVFNRYLTPLERRKVESYLAVKYGITLNGSYLDSKGNLLWDRDAYPEFHNRVTAFGCDAAGGLSQPLSSTSYEEHPTYTSLKANDSYYQSDSYNLPSSARLLVMGREYGNPLPDSGYVFWGDDAASTVTYTLPDAPCWHVMNRTWLVRSNLPAQADSLQVRWSGQGFEVSRSGFLNDILQATAAADKYAVTPVLPKGNGAIEFRCPVTHPTFDVGFSTGNEICTYGFRISSDGSVRVIGGGQILPDVIATGVSGRLISVRHENGHLYLRTDGIGNAGCTVAMPEASETYCGIVRTVTSETPLRLYSVRTGGIGDTGNQAELSYRLTADGAFAAYCRNRTVMLVDPTGEGVFDSENTLVLRCSTPDIIRGKTMFHNLFWDMDGSGSDMFTFAYYDGLAVDVRPSPSTCESGQTRKDGSVGIGIEFGTPVYTYTLSADAVDGVEQGAVVSHGTFYGESHRIDSLLPGTYRLSVSQGGGNYIYGTGSVRYDVYARDTHTYQSGEMACTVSGLSSGYCVGLQSVLENKAISYGFEVRENQTRLIRGGRTDSDPFQTVHEGDTLGMSIEGMRVIYRINGEVVHQETAWFFGSWRACVLLGPGESHILDLSVNGTTVTAFDTSGTIQTEIPGSDTVNLMVHVGSECDGSLPNGVEKTETGEPFKSVSAYGAEEQEFFTVTEVPGTVWNYHAVLKQDIGLPATLLVFDVSGRMICRQDMTSSGEVQNLQVREAFFKVPAAGVYILKTLTSDGQEFTEKIIAK